MAEKTPKTLPMAANGCQKRVGGVAGARTAFEKESIGTRRVPVPLEPRDFACELSNSRVNRRAGPQTSETRFALRPDPLADSLKSLPFLHHPLFVFRLGHGVV